MESNSLSFFEVLIYGVIQGLAEFLPISSSGHLALLPKVMHFKDPGVAFDLAMHIGTAASVALYFRKDIGKIFVTLLGMSKNIVVNKSRVDVIGQNRVLNYIVSTALTVVLVFIGRGFAEDIGRNSSLIAFNLIFFAILMFVADHFSKESKDGVMDKRNFFIAALIGVFQAIAIFPGVSRSGATLTISRWMKLSRQEAANYSFLLSLPIIIGGFILKLPDLIHSEISFLICLLGVVVSFIVGILTIHLFLKIIAKVGLLYFSIYRLIIGAIILYIM